MRNNNLFVSFYADDARFFRIISKLCEGKSYYYSIFTSGVIYFLLNRIIAVNFIKKLNKKTSVNINKLNINSIIEYELKQGIYKEKDLTKRAIFYVEFFDFIIKSKGISNVYLSGDSRLVIKSAEFCAKLNNCKTIYFEQGPFGTTILDKKGVNKNCSFRYSNFNENNKTITQKNNQKIQSIKYFRIIDLIVHNIFGLNKSFNYNNLSLPTFFKKKKEHSCLKSERKQLLLILQVPNDANLLLHSPFFKSHFEILEWTYKIFGEKYNVIVREHPKYVNRYENKLYDFINQHHSIHLDWNSLEISIQNSEFVIVNNSTVGIEVLKYSKKIIVLGDSYYDQVNNAIKYFPGIEENIINKLNESITELNGISFINYLLNHELIHFHFRDKLYDLNDQNLKKILT